MKQDIQPLVSQTYALGLSIPQAPRAFDDNKDELQQLRMPPPSEPRKFDERDLPSRPGRRGHEPSTKFTGSNTTPIGDKRLARDSSSADPSISPVVDRYRQRVSSVNDTPARGRYDDYSQSSSRAASYQSASPVDHLRTLPPVSEPPLRRGPRDETRESVDKISPPSNNLGLPRLPPMEWEQVTSRQATERSGRPTRFGPERGQALTPIDTEPRKWLTREEAERSGLGHNAAITPSGRSINGLPTPSLSARGRDQQNPDVDHFTHDSSYRDVGDNITQSSLNTVGQTRRDDSHRDRWERPSNLNERPSLEGRLSATSEYPVSDSYRASSGHRRSAHDRMKNSRRDTPREFSENQLPQRRFNSIEESDRSVAKAHSDRARLVVSHSESIASGHTQFAAALPNPVKIKRRGKSPERNADYREGNDSFSDNANLIRIGASIVEDSIVRPAAVRRGGSLLDRLTEPTTDLVTSTTQTSLRDRVDGPLTGVAGLPARPPAELTFDVLSANDGGGAKTGRGPPRRRSGAKPRKGRRGA